MSFDVEVSLRRLKPEKKRSPLIRRPDAALTWVEDDTDIAPVVLLDTTVYIDTIQDRRPEFQQQLIGRRVAVHSAIALAELTHPLGRLDPAHPGTAAAKAAITRAAIEISSRRLTAPSVRALAEAGIIAGIVARLRGIAATQLQPLLNDAALYCQAMEEGVTLLTRNVADFDLIQQVAPGGTLLFYRQTP